MARLTSYAQQYADRAMADPQFLNQSIGQTFGMSPADLERSLQCASALMAGRMPEGEALKWAQASARAQYGWTPAQVNRALNSALEMSNPRDRLAAYLAPTGEAIDSNLVQSIEGLVSSYAHADVAVDLTHRLNEGRPEDRLRDNFSQMSAPERAKAVATDRTSIRDLVSSQLGEANRPLTHEEKFVKAETMRLRLANRIEAGTAFKEGSSLRDSIADSYDVERVRAISKDVGMDDFVETAKANYEENAYAYDHNVGIEDDLPADR